MCRRTIHDRAKQLALQHYVVDPPRSNADIPDGEIDRWYDRMERTRVFSDRLLFIQLGTLLCLSDDDDSKGWVWSDLFEP